MKRTFKPSNLFLSTPLFWKKVGNTLLSLSVFIAGFSLYEGYKWVSIASFVTGVLGTLLTRFFTDEETIN